MRPMIVAQWPVLTGNAVVGTKHAVTIRTGLMVAERKLGCALKLTGQLVNNERGAVASDGTVFMVFYGSDECQRFVDMVKAATADGTIIPDRSMWENN